MNPITIRHTVRPRGRTLATNEVADLFGLDESREILTVAEGLLLDIRPGDLVIFTGPSGAGKSSLLRAAGAQLAALDAQALALPDQPLIESLPGSIGQRLDRLAACGLAEARLLLRAPSELSDGQRYRFRLAYALAMAEAGQGSFILADEFAALLDRTLAKTLAFNLRKLVSRSGIGVLAATTHDDLIDDLNPDLHIRCLGEGAVECLRHDPQKKTSVSRTSSGSRRAPDPTGRISLGGIIAATISGSSGESCCSGEGKSPPGSASSPAPPPV